MLIEILLIGIALSMDAFAVTLSSTFMYPDLKGKKRLCMPVTFGAFQGIMPILGYFLGNIFSDFINAYSGIISFAILAAIGINMIHDGIKGEEREQNSFTFKLLLALAVATSIDAFAVGVSFAAMGAAIFTSSGIIALSTFLLTLVALKLGSFAGAKLGDKSVIVGGIILLMIGIKSLL